jgi:plasmid replication initiation protein
MVDYSPKDRSPLLPDRMQQGDFFVCDIFDAAPKGDMASMEHPIFSISTKPDRRVRRYESGQNFVEIAPSIKGLATVHDRDVLIFCISQIMAAVNSGREVKQSLRFKAYDMLVATNRPTGGESYARLRDAFIRLSGTRIETNITTGATEILDGFGLIESYRIVRETRDGRMQEVEVKLSDWVFNAIRHKEVLTLHRDYFRLRKPLERRIYELARKHCGQKQSWKIGLEKLRTKCGSSSTEKEFRRLVQNIVKQDESFGHMPDYALSLEGDMMTFINRREAETVISPAISQIRLDPESHHDARTVAPGWDTYVLESEWRQWMHEYDVEPPRNPTKAFIGFCRKYAEKHGKA